MAGALIVINYGFRNIFNVKLFYTGPVVNAGPQLRQERNLCSHPRHPIPQPRRGGITCGARRSRRFTSRTPAHTEIFQRSRQSVR